MHGGAGEAVPTTLVIDVAGTEEYIDVTTALGRSEPPPGVAGPAVVAAVGVVGKAALSAAPALREQLAPGAAGRIAGATTLTDVMADGSDGDGNNEFGAATACDAITGLESGGDTLAGTDGVAREAEAAWAY